MTNFFKHAPAQDTLQKRFLETVLRKQNLLGSFPVSYPMVGLYSFAAMVGGGIAVVICPNRTAIMKNMAFLQQAGYAAPEVAVLDGHQPPHEEREILSHINHNRVRLLYTVPDRFASLTFLEMMVHSPLKFLAVEQAEFALPDFPGTAYGRIRETLDQLREKPPLVLLTQPLPDARLEQLAALLKLKNYVSVQQPPDVESTQVRVEMLVTEHQKYKTLIQLLSGRPGPGKVGRLDATGSVLIQTAYPAAADKLARAFSQYGFDSVWSYHSRREPRERALIESDFMCKSNCIVISASMETRSWMPPGLPDNKGLPFQIIYFHPPGSVEEMFGTFFKSQKTDPIPVEGTFIYTREDLELALKQTQGGRWQESVGKEERVASLKRLRRWVLSGGCRKQTLIAYYQSASVVEAPPCGVCDRCQNHPHPGFLKRALARWLY